MENSINIEPSEDYIAELIEQMKRCFKPIESNFQLIKKLIEKEDVAKIAEMLGEIKVLVYSPEIRKKFNDSVKITEFEKSLQTLKKACAETAISSLRHSVDNKELFENLKEVLTKIYRTYINEKPPV